MLVVVAVLIYITIANQCDVSVASVVIHVCFVFIDDHTLLTACGQKNGSGIVLLVNLIVSVFHQIRLFDQINQKGFSPSASHPPVKHVILVPTSVVLVFSNKYVILLLHCHL